MGKQKKMAKYFLVLILTAILSITLTGPSTSAVEEPKGEQPSLTGTWQVESAILDGQAFPKEVTGTMTLRMRGGRYEAHVGGQIDRGSYKVNETTSPMQMDIQGIEGVNKGTTFLAIYDWQEEKLRICYSVEEGKRPKKFEATQSGRFLVVYAREKK
tara:strand:+ start:514 stop:984 length:471 start_codon:yes stop_codon:yes gene_type:complete